MYEDNVIRTRFAPSPSGHLHVGGARTALFCWAYARGRGGKFILRIEDTDQKRSSDAAGLKFLEDLEWLGINWDEGPEFHGHGGGEAGPYSQSERLDLYNRYFDQLLEAGLAYRAFETPEELDALRRAARAEKRNYRYDRAGLHLSAEQVAQYLADGRPHVVRLRIPDERTVEVNDHVRGDVCVSTSELDDFVIRKPDGFPTYHFAVVVDDELMGVTHVIRAQEHLNNTIKHILLQEALQFRSLEYAHVSIISNPDGSKMSKRDKDKALRMVVRERDLSSAACIDSETWDWWKADKAHQLPLEQAVELAAELGVTLPEINVDDFKRAGYLPEALVNYLALLGWNPGDDIETFDRDFFVERFDFGRLIKSPAKFDRDKLLSFNLSAIQKLSDDEFAEKLLAYCKAYAPEFDRAFPGEKFNLFAQANKARSKTLADQLPSCQFFLTPDEKIEYLSTKATRKALTRGEPNGFDHLAAIAPLFRAASDWSVATIETVVAGYADEHADGKLGAIAQPLRIAVTGAAVSPPIYETLALLGQDAVVARIGRCLAARDVFAAPA